MNFKKSILSVLTAGALSASIAPTFVFAAQVTDVLHVSATIVAYCELHLGADTLSFGNVSSLSASVYANKDFRVTCTNGTSYQVGFDSGLNPVGTQRQMALGTNRLSYDLYRNAARTEALGDSWGVNTFSGQGAGTTLANAVTHTIYGDLPPQAVQDAGTYSDIVTVTLQY